MIYKYSVDTDTLLKLRKNTTTFVILPNDRQFKIGDTLIFREFDSFDYTGREAKKEIISKTEEHEGLKEGYVVLGIQKRVVMANEKNRGGRKAKEDKQK